jgi:hypothetical protein
MLQHAGWRYLGALALTTFLINSAGFADDAKAPDKKPNPFQALKDAYAKGVTITDVAPKDLPKAIADGAAKQAPDATVKKAQKHEIKHTMQYVAFEKPKVQWYEVIVVKDDKKTRIRLAPDGKKMASQAVPDKPAAKKEAPAAKEIEIPEKAAKAVKAIKELYPDAVVVEITTEVYQDPSGTVDVLTYEVEFFVKGTKHEMVASPAGVIPHLRRSTAIKELPQAVSDAAAKEVPEGKIEQASQFELRAGLQFVPIEKARVVYRLEMEKDSKAQTLSLREDGTPVPAPARPGGAGNRAFMGVSFEPNSVVVSKVTKDGPAAQAGVKVGDKFLMMDDAKIGSVTDVLKLLQKMKPGSETKVQIQRGEEKVTVTLKLGTPPAP